MAISFINPPSSTLSITPLYPHTFITSSTNVQSVVSSNFIKNVTVTPSTSRTRHPLVTSNVILPSKSSIFTTTSTPVVTTSSTYNVSTTTTTTTALPLIPKSRKSLLIYYVGIPIGIIGLVILLIVSMKIYKWYRRKKLIQEEFTPCYTYDQSENEMIDGVLYPSGTNSVDLLHVDVSPPTLRPGDVVLVEDTDETHLLSPTQQEMDDFASDTKRCDSVAV